VAVSLPATPFTVDILARLSRLVRPGGTLTITPTEGVRHCPDCGHDLGHCFCWDCSSCWDYAEHSKDMLEEAS
jgi:hypothetical protein